MNKTILAGNITKDSEQRAVESVTTVTTFKIAVQRRFKNDEGKYKSDFINCVAWRSIAEFIAKYFIKGQKIGIVGGLQSRSYDDAQGNRRFVTEVVVDKAEFVQRKEGDNRKGDNGFRDGLNNDPSETFAYGDIEPLGDAEFPY